MSQPPTARPATAGALLLIGLAGLIACLVLLGTIALGVRVQEVFTIDAWATPYLHGLRSPGLDALMQGFTLAGSSLAILPLLAVACAILVIRRHWGSLLFLLVATIGAAVLNATMKVFFARPRPDVAYAPILSDFSFPSGHTMNSMVFYVALAMLVWAMAGRRTGRVALVVALLLTFGVGVSRIYLGYHFLTDVLGGWLAGMAWLLIVAWAFRVWPGLWWLGTSTPATELDVPTAGDHS